MVEHTRDLMIFVETSDQVAAGLATRLIEEGQWHDLGKGWRARSDGPHVNGMKPHTHLYLRKTEVLVINNDGTPSHGSDLNKLPSNIRRAMKNKNLIESASTAFPVVPPVIIVAALDDWDHKRLMYLANRIAARR